MSAPSSGTILLSPQTHKTLVGPFESLSSIVLIETFHVPPEDPVLTHPRWLLVHLPIVKQGLRHDVGYHAREELSPERCLSLKPPSGTVEASVGRHRSRMVRREPIQLRYPDVLPTVGHFPCG